MTTPTTHTPVTVNPVNVHEQSPIRGGPAGNGGFNITVFEDDEHMTKLHFTREQIIRLTRLSAYMLWPHTQDETLEHPVEPFTNPGNHRACALLLQVNQHSTLLDGVCYSMSDRVENVQGALLQAHTQDQQVPPCSCGECPEPVVAHWQQLFGD